MRQGLLGQPRFDVQVEAAPSLGKSVVGNSHARSASETAEAADTAVNFQRARGRRVIPRSRCVLL